MSVLPDLNNVSVRFSACKILIPMLNFIIGLGWQPLNPNQLRFLVPILSDAKKKQVVIQKIKFSSSSMMVVDTEPIGGEGAPLVVYNLLPTTMMSG